jgi:hypothetical protein
MAVSADKRPLGLSRTADVIVMYVAISLGMFYALDSFRSARTSSGEHGDQQ